MQFLNEHNILVSGNVSYRSEKVFVKFHNNQTATITKHIAKDNQLLQISLNQCIDQEQENVKVACKVLGEFNSKISRLDAIPR